MRQFSKVLFIPFLLVILTASGVAQNSAAESSRRDIVITVHNNLNKDDLKLFTSDTPSGIIFPNEPVPVSVGGVGEMRGEYYSPNFATLRYNIHIRSEDGSHYAMFRMMTHIHSCKMESYTIYGMNYNLTAGMGGINDPVCRITIKLNEK